MISRHIVTIVGLFTLCRAGGSVSAAKRVEIRRPNILLIVADQWRADAFGFAGNPDVRTPTFDALAGQSVRFTNAVASVPVCSPTRASLLTGRRALDTGVFMNDVPLNPKSSTIASILANDGYETGFIGKWHIDGHGRSAFIPPDRRLGFNYWKALECTHDYNRSYYYEGDSPEKRLWNGYDAQAQTDDAIEFLRAKAHASKPFLLMLSWGPPHEPYQTAPERYRALYAQKPIRLRPNVPTDKADGTRNDLAGYYAHCTALDDCLAKLLFALKDKRLDEDTIVVFTSDHGDMIGSHGSAKKQQPWDESCRVPLLIRYPARLGIVGKEVPGTIGTEDIAPTLLGLAGIHKPSPMQGLDFSNYMAGGKDPSDGASMVMCPAPFGQWSRSVGGKEYRAVRTQRYTYARDLNGPWLLFDNVADPYQLSNLVDKPQIRGLQSKLDALLQRKLKKTGDRFEPASAYIRRWGYTIDATGTVPYNP